MAEGEESDDSQRTEDPTPKKLEEARKRGQVPMSKETNIWFMLLVSTIVIAAFTPMMARDLLELLEKVIEQSWQIHGSPGVGKVMMQLTMQVIIIMFIPLAVLFIAAIAGPFAQIGPLFSTETIMPKLDKISLVQG
ncbi:MAG: EscU/YscU/HrcU family type III secretion system export apparatus switch protein, partial [Alphaproteobacteria bacterium]|nr:EscU/YscU/HrcU family type III secretion system export apparatus switch protein [Alphaproteobacteria bacterium]